MRRELYLGRAHAGDSREARPLRVPVDDLTLPSVILGRRGSGKTGLACVLVEEALRAGVPVLVFDVKGDLPNLLLAFPSFAPEHLEPWMEAHGGPNETRSAAELARELAEARRGGLEEWGIGEADLHAFRETTELRVITPGGSAGEPLDLLSALERHSERWSRDVESARPALGAAISLVLRVLGREPDPAKSREHVLLSVLAERRLRAGQPAELGGLLQDLASPPLESLGGLLVEDILPRAERCVLAAALNTLLASPTFATWREGVTLDLDEWLAPAHGRTPGVIVSTAHLNDEERSLVFGVLLEELLSWVRTLPALQRLRALVVFDEVSGFLPPYPANPSTKRPLGALLKQARACGVGIVVATRDPLDLDYRALGNAGLCAIGGLRTDADRARVVEGLGLAGFGSVVEELAPRWFLLRNARANAGPVLFQTRWAMSWMRGPMTRVEIQRARAFRTLAQVRRRAYPVNGHAR